MTGMIVAVVLAPLVMLALWSANVALRPYRKPFRLADAWYEVPGPVVHDRGPDPGLDWWEA